MISIKDKKSLEKMETAGKVISDIFSSLKSILKPGISTLSIDTWIDNKLQKAGLVSETKGYHGYKHASCISVNDKVVHGVPKKDVIIKDSDIVSIDICASWNGYCADAARTYCIGMVAEKHKELIAVTQDALKKGIEQACVGNKLGDISSAIQKAVESRGFSVVRDFAGHGIGKNMHEYPEVWNYGTAGKGPLLKEGMTFAIEPIVVTGDFEVYIEDDGWTARTIDGGFAAHVEDTVAITNKGPKILTRKECTLL